MSTHQLESESSLHPLYPQPAVTKRQISPLGNPSREQIESLIERNPLYPPEARNDAGKTPVESAPSEQVSRAHEPVREKHSFHSGGGCSSRVLSTAVDRHTTRLPNLARTKEPLT